MVSRLFIFFAILPSCCFAQTSRDYYNELYKAGALDQILSEHACFPDEPTGNFFLLAQTTRIRQILTLDGAFDKMPKDVQATLSKDTLMFRGYNKGVPFETEEPYRKDGESWVSEVFQLDSKTMARVRFSIVWGTLRYRRSVETTTPPNISNELTAVYGRCERVPPGVQQRGK